MVVLLRFFVAGACLALGACAKGSGDDDGAGTDGGASDGARSDAKEGGGCPTGRTGPSCSGCSPGFHMCAGNCAQDLANDPDAGCSKGCGGACAPPVHSSSQCTADGVCDFVCDSSYDRTDAGCECPMGQIACMTGCAQCCQDSDCGNHMLCSGGTCAGCQPGWGDCNSNTTDGCETQLNVSGNCGQCGKSCCSSFCGCGFLGVGGESCKPSGQTYSCQC